MPFIQLETLNNTQKLIKSIEEEIKTALPLSRQYLEGQLYLLKRLHENGVNIPLNMV